MAAPPVDEEDEALADPLAVLPVAEDLRVAVPVELADDVPLLVEPVAVLFEVMFVALATSSNGAHVMMVLLAKCTTMVRLPMNAGVFGTMET